MTGKLFSRFAVTGLAVVVGTAAAIIAPAIPASAELTDEQWAAAQDRLDYWADQITGDGSSDTIASLPWFADMTYDVPTNSLTVYTKSSTNVVSSAKVSSAASEGITITEIHREKSLGDLIQAEQDLADSMESRAAANDTYSIDIEAAEENQRLITTMTPNHVTAADESGADTPEEAADAYEETLSQEVNLPVEIELDDKKDIAESTTRQNDKSPWYGGLGLITPPGKMCSGGFGASRTTSSGTKIYYMLTAWHCTAGTYKDRTYATASPPNGEIIGTVGSLNDAARNIDAAAIQISNGTAGNRVFDGAWNNPDSYSKAVMSLGKVKRGKRVCTSGANSGVHCGLKIYRINSYARYKTGQRVYGMARATADSGKVAVVQGDSGGPVFGPHNKSWASVQAMGVISGGSQEVTCPSRALAEGSCFNNVYFQPIRYPLSLYGLTLNLG